MADSLDEAAYALSEEARDGLWDNALKRIPNGQPAACPEIIEALRRKCPGYTLEEYQAAIARGMFNSR
jgi:hypothetical protein